MEIDFTNSLPLAIKYSLEPCLPILNAVTRNILIRLHVVICWLLEKPIIFTLLVTTVLAFLTPVVTFILTIFFGILCTVILLLLLEGLILAYCIILMCSLLTFLLNFLIIISLTHPNNIFRND